MKKILTFNLSIVFCLSILLIFSCRGTKDTLGKVDEDGILKLSKTHQIVFANKELGQATIVKDDVDAYFENVRILDMQIQMNATSRGDRNTLLKDYKQHLKDGVMDWTESEKTYVANVFNKAFELVSAVSPKIFPPKIVMIKDNMNHYGEGVFYTRENSIVVPLNTVERQDSADFLKTMLHEIFHIYARYHPEIKTKLYERIGYTKIDPPKIPAILERRVLLNPDGIDFNYAIKIKRKSTGQEITAIPLIFSKYLNFMPNKTDFFEYLQFYLFEIADGEVQVTRNGDSTVRIKNVTDFYDQIGTNTQYIIHPDEVLADNFTLICLSSSDKKALEAFHIREKGKQLIKDLKAIIQN